ncbi:MAG: FAD-dependent oxidoreductase, partial [Elusimicrobia bacterium]|nr:FAD-dependent oxidoreductase [Elusimicrobiota bacterium]
MVDVLVIGGGITGAGVLRDCALRGLKALLIEKGAPGEATTAASTHLVHGGIRYLLYDRLTTHATAWDAGNIVRVAGPLLKRLPIVWPVYADASHGLATVETLVAGYEPFQRMKDGLTHLRLPPGTVTSLVPGLRREGLRGGVSFDEWWVDAEGLVRANLDAARTGGAQVLTGWKAVSLLREGGR